MLLQHNRWTITDGALIFSVEGKFADWLSSRNGTLVNGKPINQQRPSFHPSRHGDQLCLGASCSFHFQEILTEAETAVALTEADKTTLW